MLMMLMFHIFQLFNFNTFSQPLTLLNNNLCKVSEGLEGLR